MAAQKQRQSKFAITTMRFMAHALKIFSCRRALGTRVNLYTIRCVWTRKFDLNILSVDREFIYIFFSKEIFEPGKKKLRIQKYPDMNIGK